MILALLGCAPDALIVPDDACRLGPGLGELRAEATCGGTTTTYRWDGPLRVGGFAGAWDGLSFFAGGSTEGGGAMTVGWRPGELGFEALEGDMGAAAGFHPERGDAVEDGTCEAVTLTGLPEAWVEGGTWGGDEDVATEWSPEWPASCALSPRAWATTRVTLTCDAVSVVELQLLAPARYVVTLDAFGRPDTVSATWSEAFAATCDGAVADTVTAALSGEGGALALDTTLFTATRDRGAWAVGNVACTRCAGEWGIVVEGLPEL